MKSGILSFWPSFTWERYTIPAKFYFAPTNRHVYSEIGNEIASASAFPNKIWERGARIDSL
jgi:hypothetical protein